MYVLLLSENTSFVDDFIVSANKLFFLILTHARDDNCTSHCVLNPLVEGTKES